MQPKRKLPDETIAIRQLLAAGLVGLPVGFLGTAAALLWLRHVLDPGPFWSEEHVGSLVGCVGFGFMGGIGLSGAAMATLNRLHYRLGYHRCPYCDRPLKGISKPCSCPEVAKLLRDCAPSPDQTP